MWDITSHLSVWPSSINQQTSVGEDVEKREPSYNVGENTDWCSHCGKQYGVTSKSKNGTAFYSSDSTSEDISEEQRNTDSKEYVHVYVHCSIIYNSQDLEAAQLPISSWVVTNTVVHLHDGILLNHKKEILSFVTAWVELKSIMLSDISQSERQVQYKFTCMWNVMNKMK